MLPGETVLPETILTPRPGVVNLLFDSLKKDCDRLLISRFYVSFQQLQVRWFYQVRHLLLCPRCRSRHLIRKGWRKRILNSSRGKLPVVVLQARCKSCGRTFRPINERIGLTFSERYVEELVDKAVLLAVQMSFARSSTVLKALTGASISAEGIRQKVAKRATALRLALPEANDTLLIDSTKVKSGLKQRGSNVYLAIDAKPGPNVAGRPSLKKRLFHLHVGDFAPLKRWLKHTAVKRVVHDGGDQLADHVVYSQRCRWHLVHQLKHYLWQDGVKLEKRSIYQKRLSHILSDPKRGENRLRRFIKALENEKLTTSAGHLKAAEAETFMDVKEPGFSFSTTSPLEREMRELNRRADIGVRWSDKGIESVLKLLFHYRLNNTGEPYGCFR